MKKLLTIICLLFPAAVYGQNTRYDNIAIGSRGVLLANQNVAVCTQPANTSTTPCSPLATIFSSAGGAAQANPLTTDLNGNYHFYATPGSLYTIQIYGPQVATPFVMTDISIPPLASNTPVLSGNNTFTGNNTLCIANGVLYVGTGCTTVFTGADIGAQINSAYASSSCPSTGCTIDVIPQSGGYSFTTPIVLNTAGKIVLLTCGTPGGSKTGPVGGSCLLNYTPTTATTAVQLDYDLSTGPGGATGHGMSYISLVNNGCVTVGGCGSSATGILLGPTNSGVGNGEISNCLIEGFGVGVNYNTNLGWGTVFRGDSILANTTGFQATVGAENTNILGGRIEQNGTGMSLVSTEIYGTSVSFDANSVVAVTSSGVAGSGLFQCTGCHFENPGLGTAHYLTGAGNNYVLIGGVMEDDVTSGTTDFMVQVAGSSFLAYGTQFTTLGRTYTAGPFQLNTPVVAVVQIHDLAPTTVSPASLITGTSPSITSLISGNSAAAQAPFTFNSAGFTFPNGVGLPITDNTASHVRKIEFGPNVCSPDFWCVFDTSGAKTLLNCQWLTTFDCQFPGPIKPNAAAGADVGTAALPWANLWLGTAATNNFKFSPAVTAAARTVSVPDPGTNVNLAFNLSATSSAFATATTAGTCVQNATAVAGAATTMVAEASPVSTPGVGAVWSAFVSSAGNVTITECAVAASAGGSIAFNIRVHP